MFAFLFELKDWVQPFGPMKSFLSVFIPTFVYHCYFKYWHHKNRRETTYLQAMSLDKEYIDALSEELGDESKGDLEANYRSIHAIIAINRKAKILNIIDWFFISLSVIQFVIVLVSYVVRVFVVVK